MKCFLTDRLHQLLVTIQNQGLGFVIYVYFCGQLAESTGLR